jgi:hypothetical protein
MMKQLTLAIACLSLLGLTTHAQVGSGWDDGYSDDPYNYDGNGGGTYDDSTTTDTSGYDSYDEYDYGDSGFDSYSYGGEEYVRSARPKFERKPYVRFSGMPYDSATELITYVEIIDVITPDNYLGDLYDGEDSLYARGLKWMIAQFGEKEVKQMLADAKEQNTKTGLDAKNREGKTIIATVTIPITVEYNEFKKVEGGKIRFDIELRFKDQRYRYKINNLVHIEQDLGGGKEDIETYMEYYLNTKKNIEHTDKILIATNNKLSTMIEELKKTCAALPFVDDDDW